MSRVFTACWSDEAVQDGECACRRGHQGHQAALQRLQDRLREVSRRLPACSPDCHDTVSGVLLQNLLVKKLERYRYLLLYAVEG